MPIYDLEEGIYVGRRAFPKAQEILGTAVIERVPGFTTVGWYDTSVHPESGAFALVREGSTLEELVGEVVRVTRTLQSGTRSVYVYVVAAYGITEDLQLYRRAFLQIANLPEETVENCVVEVAS